MVIIAFFDSYIFNNNFVETCCREEYKFVVDRIIGAVVLELGIYRVFQEECARLREGVPYVVVYRYNPKHL